MANHSYMTITGKTQGLISAGCSTQESIGNKCQNGHTDEILVVAVSHGMANIGNTTRATHAPIRITKHIDKSSPLLARALADREEVECTIDLYRTSPGGTHEKYYTIKIEGGLLASLEIDVPDSVEHSDIEPQEQLTLRYQNICWEHHQASTTGSASWGAAG